MPLLVRQSAPGEATADVANSRLEKSHYTTSARFYWTSAKPAVEIVLKKRGSGSGMGGLGQCGVGLALTAAGWLLPRRVAGARRFGWVMLLDAAPLGSVVLLLFLATGRPVYAGTIAFALGGGFAFADRTVRHTLREPVLFSALSELPQLFTHPHLYLPFAGTGLVIGAAVAALAAGLALLFAEPAIAPPHPLTALVAFGAIAGLLRRTGREPWLRKAAQVMRWLKPSGEPFADAAGLGPVAILLVYGIIARAERAGRQARLAPMPAMVTTSAARSVILVQCESFFDARRALPGLPRNFLAGYDAACAGGPFGTLDVPAWGANSTRAEFAVLTGIAEPALGYDRFNPYHALTRTPIMSQVWRLRRAGYRTICLPQGAYPSVRSRKLRCPSLAHAAAPV